MSSFPWKTKKTETDVGKDEYKSSDIDANDVPPEIRTFLRKHQEEGLHIRVLVSQIDLSKFVARLYKEDGRACSIKGVSEGPEAGTKKGAAIDLVQQINTEINKDKVVGLDEWRRDYKSRQEGGGKKK